MIALSQWRITGLVAVVLLAMSAMSFLWFGFTEDAIRSLIRGTARTSVTLFVLAFSASSLFSLYKTTWASYLLKNRRYIGLSFALSHFVHLFFLILLMMYFPEDSLAKLNNVEKVLASLTYVFILAMTLTSFRYAKDRMSTKAWHRLHSTGMFLIWLIFIETYGFAVFHNMMYLPLVLLLLAAMGLRIAHFIQQRRLEATV